jgi:hypothetical protein
MPPVVTGYGPGQPVSGRTPAAVVFSVMADVIPVLLAKSPRGGLKDEDRQKP